MTRSPLWHGLLGADTRRATTYAVASLGIGVAGCALVVFGTIYSVAFAVFGVGVALFGVVAGLAQRLVALEARRGARLLGVPVPTAPAPRTGGPFRRAVAAARDPRTYRQLGSLLVGGVSGLVVALVALGCWYLVLRGVAEVVMAVGWPGALDDAWGGSRAGAFVVHTAPAVLAWFGGPALIRMTARARVAVGAGRTGTLSPG
jgi:hypothetical protein